MTASLVSVNSDALKAKVRTVAQGAVPLILSLSIVGNLGLGGISEGVAVTAATAVLTPIYMAIVEALERVNPVFGRLFLILGKPVYEELESRFGFEQAN